MFERADADALPLSMRLNMAQAEIIHLTAALDEAKRGLERVCGWRGVEGEPNPAAYYPRDIEQLREWAERDGPLVSWGRIESALREARATLTRISTIERGSEGGTE